MSAPGGRVDLIVAARSALLDALDALHMHRDSVIVIGSQAIYLHTGDAQIALAEATKDSDLTLDARTLAGAPRLEEAMTAAGFRLDPEARQPGAWLSRDGIPVDLMVAESQAGGSGRRGARIPPHSKHAVRRTAGLEAALVDHALMEVRALDTGDQRRCLANVAGPSALHDPLAGPVAEQAVTFLTELFAAGPEALGAMMAGRAEDGVGQPVTVSASAAILAGELVVALQSN
jgi:hypothetical protein